MDDLEELVKEGLTVEQIAQIAVDRKLFGNYFQALEYVGISLGLSKGDVILEEVTNGDE